MLKLPKSFSSFDWVMTGFLDDNEETLSKTTFNLVCVQSVQRGTAGRGSNSALYQAGFQPGCGSLQVCCLCLLLQNVEATYLENKQTESTVNLHSPNFINVSDTGKKTFVTLVSIIPGYS
jgi:hypothetical protein